MHDSVLLVLVREIQKHLIYQTALGCMLTFPAIFSVSAHQALPLPTFLPHLAGPDLVLIPDDSICLFELTIPTNTQEHLLAAKARKEDRYSSLLQDLRHTGLTEDFITIEIGCLGHFMPETISRVAKACQVCTLFELGRATIHWTTGSVQDPWQGL